MINKANISKIEVNAEGSINCNWIVTMLDGSTLEFHSVDQESPVETETDRKLFDIDEKFANFLQDLWYNMDIDEEEEGEPTEATFDRDGKRIG